MNHLKCTFNCWKNWNYIFRYQINQRWVSRARFFCSFFLIFFMKQMDHFFFNFAHLDHFEQSFGSFGLLFLSAKLTNDLKKLTNDLQKRAKTVKSKKTVLFCSFFLSFALLLFMFALLLYIRSTWSTKWSLIKNELFLSLFCSLELIFRTDLFLGKRAKEQKIMMKCSNFKREKFSKKFKFEKSVIKFVELGQIRRLGDDHAKIWLVNR